MREQEGKSGICADCKVRGHNRITKMGANTYRLIFIKICPDFAVMEKSRVVIPNIFLKMIPLNARLLYLLYSMTGSFVLGKP